MKIQEIMTKDPAYATIDTSLPDVARMMADYDCGCIPVIENEENKKPIGVVTDRDITIRTVSHGKDPLNMIAGEVMSDFIVTVTPEMSVDECLEKMENNQIRRILVVDKDQNLCGIVSQADIARGTTPAKTAELVKDISISAKT
jgi:CBS domain-containing protein